MKCERCGSRQGVEQLGKVVLCETCVILILREWQIHHAEFGQMKTHVPA